MYTYIYTCIHIGTYMKEVVSPAMSMAHCKVSSWQTREKRSTSRLNPPGGSRCKQASEGWMLVLLIDGRVLLVVVVLRLCGMEGRYTIVPGLFRERKDERTQRDAPKWKAKGFSMVSPMASSP